VLFFINHTRFTLPNREQTGRSLKQHAGIPADHMLCLAPRVDHAHEECNCDRVHGGELDVIAEEDDVKLEHGQHFWSVAPAGHGIEVTINRKSFEFAHANQTGRVLKERAGIPLTDVLFRDRPREDEVIADDAKVVLECGDCFHSAPPADYGAPPIDAADVGSRGSKVRLSRMAGLC
jgi:hypothetical protein